MSGSTRVYSLSRTLKRNEQMQKDLWDKITRAVEELKQT